MIPFIYIFIYFMYVKSLFNDICDNSIRNILITLNDFREKKWSRVIKDLLSISQFVLFKGATATLNGKTVCIISG